MWLPLRARGGGPKCGAKRDRADAAGVVGDLALLPQCIRRVADVMASKDPMNGAHDAPTATPGQAGLPAEFKHINKRRRRNLQGFP